MNIDNPNNPKNTTAHVVNRRLKSAFSNSPKKKDATSKPATLKKVVDSHLRLSKAEKLIFKEVAQLSGKNESEAIRTAMTAYHSLLQNKGTFIAGMYLAPASGKIIKGSKSKSK